MQEETIQVMRHGSFRNTAGSCTQNFLNEHCLNGEREERRRNEKPRHLEATAAKYKTISVTGHILLGSGDFLSSKMFRVNNLESMGRDEPKVRCPTTSPRNKHYVQEA